MVEDGRLFVLHNRKPQILAEAFYFPTTDEDAWLACKRQFPIGASVDYPGELIVLGALWVLDEEPAADKLSKIMSRMGDWYRAYLEWEDEE